MEVFIIILMINQMIIKMISLKVKVILMIKQELIIVTMIIIKLLKKMKLMKI